MTQRSRQFYVRLGVAAAAILVVMIVAKLLFFTGERSRSNSDRPRGSDASLSGKVISWREAGEHYGEYCTIEGTVVGTHNSGEACFLNFHENWRKYLTAVIFAKHFREFPASPQDYYRGKKVRVTGTVREYQGKPEIILESPGQIEIMD